MATFNQNSIHSRHLAVDDDQIGTYLLLYVLRKMSMWYFFSVTGERRTADFSPNTSLYDLVISLAPGELNSLEHPTIMYMRQEVVGENALREKTLRQLGLIRGRAILRLLNKQTEAK